MDCQYACVNLDHHLDNTCLSTMTADFYVFYDPFSTPTVLIWDVYDRYCTTVWHRSVGLWPLMLSVILYHCMAQVCGPLRSRWSGRSWLPRRDRGSYRRGAPGPLRSPCTSRSSDLQRNIQRHPEGTTLHSPGRVLLILIGEVRTDPKSTDRCGYPHCTQFKCQIGIAQTIGRTVNRVRLAGVTCWPLSYDLSTTLSGLTRCPLPYDLSTTLSGWPDPLTPALWPLHDLV